MRRTDSAFTDKLRLEIEGAVARLIVDKRQLLPDQTVEQRRLADIWAADNGEGEWHGSMLTL